MDKKMMMSIEELEVLTEVAGVDIGDVQEEPEQLLHEHGEVAFDDVSGEYLYWIDDLQVRWFCPHLEWAGMHDRE